MTAIPRSPLPGRASPSLHNHNNSSSTSTKPYSQSHRHLAAMTAAQSVPFHCIICFDKFNSTTRFPVVLPCGHTYVCTACASRLTKCMECRAPFTAPPQLRLNMNTSTANNHGSGSPQLQPRQSQQQHPHVQQYRTGQHSHQHSPNPYHSSPKPKLHMEEEAPIQHPKNIVLMSLMEAAERSKRLRDNMMEYTTTTTANEHDDDDHDHDFGEDDNSSKMTNDNNHDATTLDLHNHHHHHPSIMPSPSASSLQEPLRRVPPTSFTDNDSCQSSLLDISREQDELEEEEESHHQGNISGGGGGHHSHSHNPSHTSTLQRTCSSSSSEEDEDDEMNRIIMGIEALSGPSGTYAVKDSQGLAVLPTHPRIRRRDNIDYPSTTAGTIMDKEEKQSEDLLGIPSLPTNTSTTSMEEATMKEHQHHHQQQQPQFPKENNENHENNDEVIVHDNHNDTTTATDHDDPLPPSLPSSQQPLPQQLQEPFRIEQGQTLQVVHYNSKEGIAKLARNQGFVVASSKQLVKVNGPLDKSCQLEGMLELVDVRKQELLTKLQELQELESGLQSQLQKCYQEEPTHPIIGNPPSTTPLGGDQQDPTENHHHFHHNSFSTTASPLSAGSPLREESINHHHHHVQSHPIPNAPLYPGQRQPQSLPPQQQHSPQQMTSRLSLPPPSIPLATDTMNNNSNSNNNNNNFDQEEKYDDEHVGLQGSGGFPVVQLHGDETPNANGIEMSTPPRSYRAVALSPNTIDNADLCMQFHPHHFLSESEDDNCDNVPFVHSMEEGICHYPTTTTSATAAAAPTNAAAVANNGDIFQGNGDTAAAAAAATTNNAPTTTTTLPRPNSSSLLDQYGGGCGPSFFLAQSSPFGGGAEDEDVETLVGLSIDTSNRSHQHHGLQDDEEGNTSSQLKKNNIHRQVMNSSAAASRLTAGGRAASSEVSPIHGGGGGGSTSAATTVLSGHHLYSSSLYAYHSGAVSVGGHTTAATSISVPQQPYLSSTGRSASHTSSTGGSFDSVDFRTGMSGHRGALSTRTSSGSRQRAFPYRSNVRLMGEHRGAGRPPGRIPRSNSHY